MQVTAASASVIFASAFLAKLSGGKKGVAFLTNYGIVPRWLAVPLSIGALVMEGTAAVLLVVSRNSGQALLLASSLFCAFGLATWLALARNPEDKEIPCGCLGPLAPMNLGRADALKNFGASIVCLLASWGSIMSTNERVFWLVVWMLGVLVAGTYWLASFAFSVLALVGDRTRAEQMTQ